MLQFIWQFYFIAMQCIMISSLGAQASLFAPERLMSEPSSNNPSTSPSNGALSNISTPTLTSDISFRVSSTMEWDFVCSPDTSLVHVAQVVEASIRCNLEQIVGGINRIVVYELCTQVEAVHMTSIRFNAIISPSCTKCEEAAAANEVIKALERIAIDGSLADDIEKLSKGEIKAVFSSKAISTYDSLTNSPVPVSSPSLSVSRSPTPLMHENTQYSASNLTIAPTPSAIQSPISPTVVPTSPSAGGSAPPSLSSPAPSPADSKTTLSPTGTSSYATTMSNESEAEAAFYPDWHGDNVGCLNDGNQPDWVMTNSLYYISNTLEECCIKFYQWNMIECTGSKGTGKWFMQYSTGKCVKDCEYQSDCGGYAAAWDDLWDSKLTCCLKKKWWDVMNC